MAAKQRRPSSRRRDAAPSQRHSSKGGKPRRQSPPFKPRVNKKLVPILEGIGVPEATPFVPDPFQTASVEKLAQADVVVSAPTGSGKTWIAEQAIAQTLARGEKAWYASPLKALSNSKYAEFGEIYGAQRVGILTGERKENLSAPLLVGTTEILRNQLYDAMYRGADLAAGLVVLDEAHFLGDPERGVVWEEVIIYLPVRVRLLLLSATVANAGQIARWLTWVRGTPCQTVSSDERPVPLYPMFLFPDGELTPLKKNGSGLFPKVRHFVEQDSRRRQRGPAREAPPFGQILRALEKADLLPAIFFLKSRADCDGALSAVAGAGVDQDELKTRILEETVAEYTERYQFLAGHPHLENVKSLRVAAHHAGHLPHWKILVEKLMKNGVLKAIFSTSTVAAGVNFPARTVVITQSDRFNGQEFVDLRATDLLQMTGRAGRRGMDKIGFCLTVPGTFNDVSLVAALLSSEPEPIESQLHINFSMVLNLLLSQKPHEVKQLLSHSLATFQRLEASGGRTLAGKGLRRVLAPLAAALTGSSCPGPEEAVIRRRRRRQLTNLRHRLEKRVGQATWRGGIWGALNRGRVFMDMFGSPAAVLRREDRGDEPGVLAVSLVQEKRLSRGKPRIDFVPLNEIAGLFGQTISLPRTGGGRMLADAVLGQAPEDPVPLKKAEMQRIAQEEKKRYQNLLNGVNQEVAEFFCRKCSLFTECQDPKGEINTLLDRAEDLLNLMQDQSHAFWYDFVRRLEFLRSESFVDEAGRLSEDGAWTSKLRLDQPVLIAEAIRKNALPEDDPALLAALVALFVDDREREADPAGPGGRLKKGILTLQRSIDPMMNRLRQWGFPTPVMPLSAAQAVLSWALGTEFKQVVLIHGGGEGDLANLIYRTADNLRQLISLKETHPRLAQSSREAVDLLLREPVVVPT